MGTLASSEFALRRLEKFSITALVFGIALLPFGDASAQSWVQLAPPGQAPDARSNMNAVYDPAGNAMVVFGGGSIPRNNATTVLSNADGFGGTPAWTVLSPIAPLPAPRAEHGVTYDAANDVLMTYGGFSGSGDHQPLLNDVWALANASGQGGTPNWTQLMPTGGPPTQRAAFPAVYDSISNRMVIFGGCTGPDSSSCNTGLNDTWVLTNANGLGGAPQWIQLQPQGPLPIGRNSHTAVYDQMSNRLIVFGGVAGGGGAVLNDVWVLTNANGFNGPSQWIQLMPSNNIPPRYNQTATYDPVSGSMTVFSGVPGGTNQETNEVWVLSNANGVAGTPAWTQLSPAGSPPLPRENADAIYDLASNRMTIFSGVTNCSSGCVTLSDVWVLTNANGTSSPGLAITQVLPNHGGNAGNVTVQIIGSGFAQSDQVSLTSGGTNIQAVNTTIDGPGLITATFSLSGAVAGPYDITVIQSDGGRATLPAGLTVDQGGVPNISVQIIGRSTIQFGKATTFYMEVSNNGNIDSDASLVSLSVPSSLQYVQMSGSDLFTAGSTSDPEFAIPGQGNAPNLLLATPSVPVGQSQTAPIPLTVPIGGPVNFTLTAASQQDLAELSLDDFLGLEHIPFIPFPADGCPACLNNYNAEVLAETDVINNYKAFQKAKLSLDTNFAKTTSAIGITIAGAALVESLGLTTLGAVSLGALIAVASSCVSNLYDDQGCLPTLSQMMDTAKTGARDCLAGSPNCFGGKPLPQNLVKALNTLIVYFDVAINAIEGLSSDEDSIGAEKAAYGALQQSLGPYGLAQAAYQACLSPSACTPVPPPPPPSTPPGTTYLPVTAVQSLDPNDKVGATGEGAQGYVTGVVPLSYSILFGNKDTATAPAQQVVITDQLDTTKLDIKNFGFGSMSFGTEFASPARYQTTFATTIDLRPTTNLLVNLSAALDATNGLARWAFTSIDPATGLPPTDPTIGFLPPGGNGAVFVTVSPKQNLATNTQIQNLATITFDNNPAINTPAWLNTIDADPPNSSVQSLPSTEAQLTFPVSWSGSDKGSGVATYNVYVSDNSGAFTLWQSRTATTSATYNGQLGHSYGFYSIATDAVGNVEAAKIDAEARTTVVSDGNFTLGASPSSLAITRGGNGNVTLTVTPSGGFNEMTSFSCSGLPTLATCSFSPSTVTPNGPVTTTMTIMTTGSQMAGLHPSAGPYDGLRKLHAGLWGSTLLGIVPMFVFVPIKWSRKTVVLTTLTILLAGLTVGCGGGQSAPTSSGTPLGSSTITVMAQSSSGTQHSVTIQLVVQ